MMSALFSMGFRAHTIKSLWRRRRPCTLLTVHSPAKLRVHIFQKLWLFAASQWQRTRKTWKSDWFIVYAKQHLIIVARAFYNHESSRRRSDMWAGTQCQTCCLSPPTCRSEEGGKRLACINTSQNNSNKCIAKHQSPGFWTHPNPGKNKASSQILQDYHKIIRSCSQFRFFFLII